MNALVFLDLSLLQHVCSRAKSRHEITAGQYMRKKSPLEADQFRGWKRNHESCTIATKHVRIMNLCFKNLGIMNLCTSARESWITRLWEKLNKIHVWINCVRSRECRIWRFNSEGPILIFFSGETCPRTPYIIRVFEANSPLVPPITLCLMFIYKKLHAKTKRMMIASLNEAEVWTQKNTKRDRNVAAEKNH